MQPNQNSFRLGRLSNTSDFRKHSTSQYTTNPKDTFKLAALTSITRGIKHNDLSFITGRQLPKLRKQPQQNGDNFEYGAAHDNLTSIRKKHDNVNKQKLQIENKIALLKEQRQKFQIVENQYQGNRNQGSDKVKSMENQLQNIRLQYQQGQWNKKIYLMLTQRIKHDRVVYDQRKYDLEKQLEHLRKQLKIFVKQGTGITEQTDRTSKVYQKLLKQLQSQQTERQAHLSSLQSSLNNKYIVNQSNQLRKNEMDEIAIKAMQDKNEDEINWIHILEVHKFVHNFLRNKMNRQMDKFYTVQMAFKNIKIATGVHDAQTLIYKFLNKQQVYGQLLSKIAENQRQLIELKAHRDHILKQRKQLKQQKRANYSKKKQQIQFRDDLKQVQQIGEKSKSAELKTQNLRTWMMRNMKKICNIDKSQQDVNISRGPQQVAAGFKKFIALLSQQIDKSSTLPTSSSQPGSLDLNIKTDVRAFRAKPKSQKILNSGEQVQNQFDEEELPATQDQQELITNQRQDILKQNQKFMKDLKRKMEEIKRLRIQAEPKKKSTTSPDKKAVAQDQ